MHRTHQHGFTAIEALIVVAIAGILAAIAAPSMRTLMTTQSIKAMSYDLVSDFAYARGEAIARSTNVTVQSLGGNDWKHGWTITESTGSTTLRTQGEKFGAYTVSGSGGSLVFNRSGRATTSVSVSVAPTDSTATIDMKRCIVLDPSGRVRSLIGACT